ncbi:polyprenyl synthetase family protein [Ectothiorhodospiraceae bacterium BW-2]|nr:polyprenyl synthetase family protein [Ectothiorhodospiraceae bacterium BW-2]
MNKFEEAENSYHLYQNRAKKYYQQLISNLNSASFLLQLEADYKRLKSPPSGVANIVGYWVDKVYSNAPPMSDAKAFLNYLDGKKQLHNYLDRSIGYIFLRDLGKDLSKQEVQSDIEQIVGKLEDKIVRSILQNSAPKKSFLSLLFKKSCEYNAESALVWLIEKLQLIQNNIPPQLSSEQALRKLVKIVAGVVMIAIDTAPKTLTKEERGRRYAKAVRLGYAYGLTYPFIDDILDHSSVLTAEEKLMFSDMIRTTLVEQGVPVLQPLGGENGDFIYFVYQELKEAFQTIKNHQFDSNIKDFYQKAYLFFNSQELDRAKIITNTTYSNEDIFIPLILKSASSRLMARSVLGGGGDSDFDDNMFYYGIYNQFNDDIKDIDSDLLQGVVTPYTYYLKHYKKRADLVNPYEIYWSVVFTLIYVVYKEEPIAKKLILERTINAHKSLCSQKGLRGYHAFMDVFKTRSNSFNSLIKKITLTSPNIYWFDKLISVQITDYFYNKKTDAAIYSEELKRIGNFINKNLKIEQQQRHSGLDETLVEAANYSLGSGGKRLRPMLAYIAGVDMFGIKQELLIPLFKSIEYMHTSSLIFDDKPTQDNAEKRRGRAALHVKYGSESLAELTGVFIILKAVEEQASLSGFDATIINRLIKYSAEIVEAMCKGQYMDLSSKEERLTLEQLENLSFYKTGLAIEASLMMPAVLKEATDERVDKLKVFARHAGIAFQIRDDILDEQGDPDKMGKPIEMDKRNRNATFVTVLGVENAKIELYRHYFRAMDALDEMPSKTDFLRFILDYFVLHNR